MTDVDPSQVEWMLNRFRRLMQELERGNISRNTFEPWEIETLMDILGWGLQGRQRWAILRQYARAVEKQMEYGPGPPMRFAEFLAAREDKKKNQ